MKKLVTTVLVVFFLGALGVCFAGADPGVTDDKILIGALAPLTGPASTFGVNVRDGGQLYFDLINEAGGVNGRKIEVIWEDTACYPTKAVGAVKKLIQRDKVFALWGGGCSNAIISTIPIIEKAKLPFLTSNCSAPPITQPTKPYIFRAGYPPTDSQVYGLAQLAHEYFGIKKMSMIHLSGEYGFYYRDMITEYCKQHNLELGAVEAFNMGDADFTAQLLNIKKFDPEAVFLVAWVNEGAIIMRQANKMGIDALWIGAAPTGEETFTEIARDDAAGSIHIWPLRHLLSEDQPMINEFNKEFNSRFPPKPGRPAVGDIVNYSGAMVFVEGLKRAGRKLTREKFAKALESIKDFETPLYSPVTFAPDKHHGNFGFTFVIHLRQQKRALLDYHTQ